MSSEGNGDVWNPSISEKLEASQANRLETIITA